MALLGLHNQSVQLAHFLEINSVHKRIGKLSSFSSSFQDSKQKPHILCTICALPMFVQCLILPNVVHSMQFVIYIDYMNAYN